MKQKQGEVNTKKSGNMYVSACFVVVLLFAGCSVPENERVTVSFAAADPHKERLEPKPALGPDAGLEQILTYAALQNPGLKSMYHEWRSAQERIPAAGALPDPQLSYTHFLREVETKVGPQQGKVAVSQMIPSLGTLGLTKDVAALKADVFKARFEQARAELFHKVRVLYFDYYYHIQAVRLVQENLQRLVSFKPVVETAYKTAEVPYAHLLRVQIAIDREKEHIASLKDSLLNIKNRINTLLDRPAHAELPDPVLPPAFTSEEEDMGAHEIDLVLAAYNPDLIILDRRLKMEAKALELARHNDAPDYMIGAGWVITGGTDAPVEDPGKDPVTLMFGLSIPLNRGKYRSLESSQRETLRSFEKKRHDMKNRLSSRARILVQDIKEAERKIILFRENLIEKAEQSFNVSQTAFKGGKADFLDMLDSINLIIKLQLKAEKAVVMKAKHISGLYRLFGDTNTFFKGEGR